MLDIAINSNTKPVSFKDISSRQGISIKYMEQIGSLLNKAGLIKSVRGAQGGYLLVKSPREYTIAEIIGVTEGEMNLVPCVDCEFSCDNISDCLTAPFWKRMNSVIDDFLKSYTLQDILDRKFDPIITIEE